jgi:hypothetical protein
MRPAEPMQQDHAFAIDRRSRGWVNRFLASRLHGSGAHTKREGNKERRAANGNSLHGVNRPNTHHPAHLLFNGIR